MKRNEREWNTMVGCDVTRLLKILLPDHTEEKLKLSLFGSSCTCCIIFLGGDVKFPAINRVKLRMLFNVECLSFLLNLRPHHLV